MLYGLRIFCFDRSSDLYRSERVHVEDTLLYKGNSFDSDESQLVEVKNIIDSVPIIYDEITNTDVKINQENIDKFFFLVRKA